MKIKWKRKKSVGKKKIYFWSDFSQALCSSCEADKLFQIVFGKKG